ncbi:MAG: hypothetical protein JSV88_20280, partial [Candidatus Aminicenantes bacterium]
MDIRRKNSKSKTREIGELPYYDFILLGHSFVGKTTYLTMLCWIGGSKNKEWNFKVGGSGLDVTFIPAGIKNDRYKKKKFVDLVDATASNTGREINKIFEKIGNQDGSFSTTAQQEFVFSFRPIGADKEH